MIPTSPFQFLVNRHHGTPGVVVLPDSGFRRAKEEIASWPGYAPTPLRRRCFATSPKSAPGCSRPTPRRRPNSTPA